MTRRGLGAMTLAVLAAACGGDSTGSNAVTSVTVSGSATALIVGQTTQLTATARTQSGTVLASAPMTWSTSNSAVATVSPAGVVRGVAAGTVTIRATSGGVTGELPMSVIPIPIASVSVAPAARTLALSDTVTLTATVRDGSGNALTGRTVTWSSSAPARVSLSATTGASVIATAVAPGTVTVTATSEGHSGQATITVNAAPSANAPTIASVAGGALITAGETGVAIVGTNFSTTPAQNFVTIDGVAATVTAATATQLTITVPARSSFGCVPMHAATVRVKVGSDSAQASAPLQVATPRSLAVGAAAVLTDPAQVWCNELANTGGRYLISVVNTADVTGATTVTAVSLQLRGAAGSASLAAQTHPMVAARTPVQPLRAAPPLDPAFARAVRGARRVAAAHMARLANDATLLTRVLRSRRTSARASRDARLALPIHASMTTSLGGTSTVRIRRVDDTNCSQFDTAVVRTVYVGTHVIVAEDTAYTPPGGKGALDTYYAQLGQEFETVMWPILTNNFGSPLAYDAQTDGDGKMAMVFSPVVNAQSANLLGFVNPCDFLPQAADRASNQGEYFYAIVPRTSDGQTPEEWFQEIRPTLIHETKHVVSDAERFAAPCTGDCTLEAPWLEEATATLAQELYLRTFSPQMTFRGDVTYTNSLACDLPAGRDAGCSADHPVTLTTTGMAFLYAYLDDHERLSFLGQATPGDGSWYGGGWMFARWVVDQYAGSGEG
ncbi:MAG: Ig domain-containing protein, partial [Gemmatimonadaceae bacterium]|nr:Ig domain-containing protein [Gemmatimonadaceae bacterium]